MGLQEWLVGLEGFSDTELCREFVPKVWRRKSESPSTNCGMSDPGNLQKDSRFRSKAVTPFPFGLDQALTHVWGNTSHVTSVNHESQAWTMSHKHVPWVTQATKWFSQQTKKLSKQYGTDLQKYPDANMSAIRDSWKICWCKMFLFYSTLHALSTKHTLVI
jgi:hypothetical protein